jgi:hypothetical protein
VMIGGSAQPVAVSTGTPDGGPALRVAVVTGQVVTGGPAMAVIEVSDGRPVQGNEPLPISLVSDGRPTIGGPAIPVYVVSGSLNPIPPFSPSDIAGLLLWLKADAITGLNDGDPVVTWPDSSGNGRDATQGAAGNRPTYETAVLNGKPVVRFDATDDRLATASIAHGIGAGDFTWVVVAQVANAAANYSPIMANGSFAPALYFHDNRINLYWAADHGFTGTTTADNTWYTILIKRLGTDVTLRLNGADDGTPFSLNNNMANAAMNLGFDGSGGALGGDEAELLFYNSALDATETANIESYLRSKYAHY